jgi:hypothetical protein
MKAPSDFFPPGFPTEILYTLLRATCPAPLILFDLIILIILGEDTSYEAPHYAVFSSLSSLAFIKT